MSKYHFFPKVDSRDKGVSSEWVVKNGPKEAEDCSFVKEGYVIKIPQEVNDVILYLCNEIKLEWQMLLTGEVVDNTVMICGYYIPKQVVTGGTVEHTDDINKKFIDDNKIVCTIHSHGDIGACFSSRDDNCTNLSSIKHHVVTNNRGDFEAQSIIDLPCGHYKLLKSKVVLSCNKDIKVEGIENIEIRDFAKGHASIGFNSNREIRDSVHINVNSDIMEETIGYVNFSCRKIKKHASDGFTPSYVMLDGEVRGYSTKRK